MGLKGDLDLGKAGPVFFAQGAYDVPDDEQEKIHGRMIGEIQHTEAGYVALYYPGRQIIELGERDSFGDALHEFAAWRYRNRGATSGGAYRIRQRIRHKALHVCLFCGVKDPSVQMLTLREQRLFLCKECFDDAKDEKKFSQQRLEALLHILKQRPEAPNMAGWLKVSERNGFELWYRRIDSGVYVDQFTVVRGKDKWQLGTDGAEMVDTPIDREMRQHFPNAYDWAVEQIARFCLKRAHQMLDGETMRPIE